MKKTTLLLALFTVLVISINAQTVTIGKQVWMAKNLNMEVFRNGDPIPQAKTDAEWKKAGENKQPAWCYYNNDPANGTKYGKLYNWYAVNDPRGLAPKDWHIPSDSEWSTLIDFLGGNDVAGKKMKSTSGWKDDGNGTNEIGFSGLPGGSRNVGGAFHFIGSDCFWWSSTEVNPNDMWLRYLSYNFDHAFRFDNSKRNGFSVRCLRD